MHSETLLILFVNIPCLNLSDIELSSIVTLTNYLYPQIAFHCLYWMCAYLSSWCIRLCQECQTLIENHDQIKLLSNARNNLNTTLKVGFLCHNLFYLYRKRSNCWSWSFLLNLMLTYFSALKHLLSQILGLLKFWNVCF